MTGKPGIYLTPEQSVRLAIKDSLDREALVAAIVKRNKKLAATHQKNENTPAAWYSHPISRDL